ncbi:PAS domain-containing sensor histidine kinase [Deinococcus hopiensis]|uniref:histidine kinase n=1 Tax=Deinococcus hopiensis KR-140 TaxID=695939 RepID=A0A1W1VWH5_9DEIO|nr:PAS domain S-box protein [Deinococcus hopiensis]SMB97678.1 PAS domain S-box-containing protein [Deinococcus hopiensis KR-140]
MIDILLQNNNQTELDPARDRFAKVFSASPVGIVLTGLHSGRVLESNDAFLQIIGCSQEQFVGSTNEEINPWVNLEDRLRLVEQMEQNGTIRNFEAQLRHVPTGGVRHVLLSAERLALEGEEVIMLMAQDISSRKSAEEAVLASERRFRALVQNSSDTTTVVNRGGYITYMSPSMTPLLGYTADEMLGQNVLKYMHPDDHDQIKVTFAQALHGGLGATRRMINRFQHHEGGYRWLEWAATNRLDDPDVRGIVLNARDVTERHLAEEALKISQTTFAVLFEHSPDAIILVDFQPGMPIVKCNQAAAAMDGYTTDELIGQSIFKLLPNGEELLSNQKASEGFMNNIRAQGTVRFETSHKRKDGSIYPVDTHLTLIDVDGQELLLSIYRDVTARKAAEEALKTSQAQLVASERLASLGRLTAGLAHEINTPLAATMNYHLVLQGLLEEYRASIGNPDVTTDDHREIAAEALGTLEEAGKTTTRIGEFIRQMRGHTRDTVTGTTTFNPFKLAGDTLAMLAHEARAAQVELHLESLRGEFLITGEPGRFTQVVTNLVINAIHACETVGHRRRVDVRFVQEGTVLKLQVQDNGSGIPPEVLPKIFDPMFTTKDVGKGTGLGLAIIHDIVQGHFGGHIEVHTQVGTGTTFTVTFHTSSSA